MNIIRIILEVAKATKLSFDEVFCIVFDNGICNESGFLTTEFLENI